MKHNLKKSDNGVSPVIAVMLMLSITVILAALVSSYAGGFASTEKVPQVSIRGTFSQSLGQLEVEHMGKDPVSTTGTTVLITCSETFGSNANLAWTILHGNISRSPNNFEENWNSNVTVFKTGDSFFVNTSGIFSEALFDEDLNFSKSDNLGKTFYVSLIQNGKMYARSEVLIRG